MTPYNQELYNRLYACQISDLELMKEMADRVIFDKIMNKLMEEEQ